MGSTEAVHRPLGRDIQAAERLRRFGYIVPFATMSASSALYFDQSNLRSGSDPVTSTCKEGDVVGR
jgi:hypothetical protein